MGPDARLWAVTERPAALLRLTPRRPRWSRPGPSRGCPTALSPSPSPWRPAVRSGSAPRARCPADPTTACTSCSWRPPARSPRRGGRALERLVAEAEANRDSRASAGDVPLAVGEPTESGPGGRRSPRPAYSRGLAAPLAGAADQTGKAAGLWCTTTPTGGVRVVLERHYGVLTLHEAHLPAGAAAGSTLPLLRAAGPRPRSPGRQLRGPRAGRGQMAAVVRQPDPPGHRTDLPRRAARAPGARRPAARCRDTLRHARWPRPSSSTAQPACTASRSSPPRPVRSAAGCGSGRQRAARPPRAGRIRVDLEGNQGTRQQRQDRTPEVEQAGSRAEKHRPRPTSQARAKARAWVREDSQQTQATQTAPSAPGPAPPREHRPTGGPW